MDSTTIITAMILSCLALIALMILAKPLKFILRVVLGGVMGSFVIMLLNTIGLNVGVNFLTASFVGLLGIPGLVGLVALSLFL